MIHDGFLITLYDDVFSTPESNKTMLFIRSVLVDAYHFAAESSDVSFVFRY